MDRQPDRAEIAIERVQAKKVITFHTRVRMAKEFATNEPRGIAYHLGGYEVRHVNGIQSSSVRSEIITAFADAPRALLTNARCLTEGVDIPAVDMVAFIDPRRSRIDIAQAVGRAMRKPRNGAKKELGFVVVPLFAEKDAGDLDAVVKSEGPLSERLLTEKAWGPMVLRVNRPPIRTYLLCAPSRYSLLSSEDIVVAADLVAADIFRSLRRPTSLKPNLLSRSTSPW